MSFLVVWVSELWVGLPLPANPLMCKWLTHAKTLETKSCPRLNFTDQQPHCQVTEWSVIDLLIWLELIALRWTVWKPSPWCWTNQSDLFLYFCDKMGHILVCTHTDLTDVTRPHTHSQTQLSFQRQVHSSLYVYLLLPSLSFFPSLSWSLYPSIPFFLPLVVRSQHTSLLHVCFLKYLYGAFCGLVSTHQAHIFLHFSYGNFSKAREAWPTQTLWRI